MHTTQDLEEPVHQEFETGAIYDQPVEEVSQHPHWFQKQAKSLTPDHAWNKTSSVTYGPFVMNWLKVDTMTHKLLVGPTYKLMKGSCKSLEELEFFLEEVYKATTDQLDWVITLYLSITSSTTIVSTEEPKNIKEAMANSAWIKAMQEELH
uniref:Gag-Pol polyprotein n=1 Tax=Tanacetum cinerariifolium TaxID=118510 RepID=A0A699KVE5_TANCI|nr:hypothetical protein [Tanacetum cinerariifolium]